MSESPAPPSPAAAREAVLRAAVARLRAANATLRERNQRLQATNATLRERLQRLQTRNGELATALGAARERVRTAGRPRLVLLPGDDDATLLAAARAAADAATAVALGRALAARGAWPAAAEALAATRERFPDDPGLAALATRVASALPAYHRRHGRAAFERRDWAAAIEHLTRLLELVPDHPWAGNLLDRALGAEPARLALRLAARDGERPRRRLYVTGCGRSGTWLLLGMMTTFRDTAVLMAEAAVGRFARLTAPEPVHVLKRAHDSHESLAAIPPAIELLHLVRFPLDVLVSRHRDRARHVTPERWRAETAALRALLEAGRAGLMVVRYEDLVREPDRVQAAIAERFALEPELPFSRFAERARFDSLTLEAMKGLRAPETGWIGAWRRDPEAIAHCRAIWPAIAADVAWLCARFGYERPDPELLAA